MSEKLKAHFIYPLLIQEDPIEIRDLLFQGVLVKRQHKGLQKLDEEQGEQKIQNIEAIHQYPWQSISYEVTQLKTVG